MDIRKAIRRMAGSGLAVLTTIALLGTTLVAQTAFADDKTYDLWFGDSQMYGQGIKDANTRQAKRFSRLVSNADNASDVNVAVTATNWTGTSSNRFGNQIDKLIANYSGKNVKRVIGQGVHNDAEESPRISAKSTDAELKAKAKAIADTTKPYYAKLRQAFPNAQIAYIPQVTVWGTPQKNNAFFAAILKVGAYLADDLKQQGWTVMDMQTDLNLIGDHQDYLADTIHVNEKGHAAAARGIIKWLDTTDVPISLGNPSATVKVTFNPNGGSSIAAGANGSMAITSDGVLYTWGQNTHGQLGDGTKTDSASPKQVSGKYTRISNQGTHTVALSNDGVFTWGEGADGRLGDGSTKDSATPHRINGKTFTRIAAGETHTLALDAQGHLWAWGDNSYGQLGNGTKKDVTTPVEITPDRTYASIAVGAYHSLALDTQGHLWAWGYDQEGELGDNGSTAVPTPKKIGTATYAEVYANGYASFALDAQGRLYGWGYNLDGMVGDGTTTDVKTPKRIGSTTFGTVSVGYFHTLALDTQGHLWAWGRNPTGQLGDGTVQNSTVPKEITPDRTYTQIAAGANHSLAVDGDNNLWAWGYGKDGELGYTITRSSCSTAKSVEGSGLDTCPTPARILNGKAILAVNATPTTTTHTVTFNPNGGSATAKQTVKDGGKATRPSDPTRSGYTFTGWTLNGKAYDFTTPVTGDITIVAQWKTNAATGGDTLSCRSSGAGATGPKAGNFCWVDFSDVNLNDAKWSAGVPITVSLPGATMTATMQTSTNKAAENHWRNYKPYTDAGYDKLTNAQRKTLLSNGMTGWSPTWLALWKAYALPDDMELPAFDTYNVQPKSTDGEATITLTGISLTASRGYTLNNDWYMTFGDAEIMSGHLDSTGKQTQYEQTTVSSDKPVAKLGYALGNGGDDTYGVTNTLSGNTLTVAGGNVSAADKYGYTYADDAIVATSKTPATFKVDFSQHGGMSGRSAIAIGLQLPWRTQASLNYDPNGGSGTMPSRTADTGTKVTVDKNGFTRPSYTFTGWWNTKADGTGESWAPGKEITLNGNITVYAQWKPSGFDGLPGTGGASSWLPMVLGGGFAAIAAGAVLGRTYIRRRKEDM